MQILVDELPESCFECPIMVDGSEGCDFCVCAILEEKATTKNRLKDCPLHSIKVHDRELIKKVCEKIRSELEKELKYDFTSYVPIMNVCNKINRVLDQTQKEYEK